MGTKAQKQKKISAGWVFVYILMAGLLFFTLLPLIYMVSTAFKPFHELFIFPPRFFVREPTLQNFADLVTAMGSVDVPFVRYIFNSSFIAVVNVIGSIFICTLGAYGLSKLKPKGSKFIFSIVIAALMFSPEVTRIPTFLVIEKLKLIDTYWALILPKLVMPMYFFLMKQFTDQFPDEYLESAKMDGANHLQCYWKILMPNLKPAWMTLILFAFQLNWNDSQSALIYITKKAMKTLPLAVKLLSGGISDLSIARFGVEQAAALMMMFPIMVIFTLTRKKIIETMTYSGLKG